jgi:polysaccharide pyruvyl transferase WcaK-like protein
MPGAGNIGDDLISVMLTQHLWQRWPKAEIGILSAGYPIPFPYAKPVYFLPMPRRRSWSEYSARKRLIEKFARTSDLILIGGGGLFQDSHYRFTIHKWLREALATSYERNPVATVGIGVGPLNHKLSAYYLKKALDRLSVIQVRDVKSAEIVTSLGYQATIAPDIVLGTSLVGTPFAISTTKEAFLGCSLRPWPRQNFEALISLIVAVAKKNQYAVRLFVFEHAEPHNTSELEYAQQVAKALAEANVSTEILCYGQVQMEQFATAFNQVSLAIASRFHANILWQKIGLPTLPIAYAPKVRSMYEERGGRALSVTLDEWQIESESSLFQKLDLQEVYELPPTDDLLREAEYKQHKLYTLGLVTAGAETIYGLGRSASWRLQRIWGHK